MTPPEREAFLADLVFNRFFGGPVVKEAIPLCWLRAATWLQQHDKDHGNPPATIRWACRRKTRGRSRRTYPDRVASLYFQTHNHYLVQETLNSIWRCLSATSPVDLNEYYLKNGAWSVDLYASRYNSGKKTHGTARVRSAKAKQRITAMEGSLWIRLWQWVPYGVIFLASSVAALVILAAPDVVSRRSPRLCPRDRFSRAFLRRHHVHPAQLQFNCAMSCRICSPCSRFLQVVAGSTGSGRTAVPAAFAKPTLP